ncbi:MAG: hypothetical protein HUK02_01990 [Bacteroidaceae bacterium]|nr:hypothetical protein [Bacteroidaceae bacterium]
MKKTLLSLLAVVCMLGACRSDENEGPSAGQTSITFQVMNYSQEPMGEVRAVVKSVEDLPHLDMAVYDAATHERVGEVVRQTDASQDFGTFSVSLPYGDYVVVFLGYENRRLALLDNPCDISFEEDYVPNCFCHTLPLKVDANTERQQSVVLTRCVAAFTLKTVGDIPADFSTLTISGQGGSGHFNALTGFAPVAADRSWTYTSVASFAGKTSMEVDYYTFLPAEQTVMQFSVSAYDVKGSLLKDRNFPDVPMQINQRSRFTGNFFATTESQSFSISLGNTEWSPKDFSF